MSVASEPKPTIAAWQPLSDTVSEFRAGCSDLETTLDELFQEVDQLRVDVAEQVRELETRHVQLRQHEEVINQEKTDAGQLAEQLREKETELSAALNELEELREALAQEREKHSQQSLEQNLELDERLEQLQRERDVALADREAAQQERDAAYERVEHAQTELTRLANVEVELAETRRQLVQAQSAVPPSWEGGRVTQDFPARDEQFVDFQQERDALEAELELVRGRAAELDETVAEQKEEITQQRAELAGEVRALQRLVEKQAEMIADRAGKSAAVVEEPPERTANPQADDPVVTSVMAQFAKLQKDVAQRRRRRG